MIMSDVCRLPFADADAADDNLKCVFTSSIHMCITIICTFFSFSVSLHLTRSLGSIVYALCIFGIG